MTHNPLAITGHTEPPRGPQAGSQHLRPRRAFTLVELMITITIITILIGLLIPVVSSSITSVRIARVRTELNDIESKLADFKATFGVSPPSRITLYETGSTWTSGSSEANRSRALILQMWPQFNFGANIDINGNGTGGETLTLNGAECLVFFLGGVQDSNGVPLGFSKNPSNPFSTSGNNRVGPFYEFDTTRLVDRDGDGMDEYVDSLPSQQNPILYVSAYDGRGYDTGTNLTNTLAVFSSGSGNLSDIYRQNSGASAAAWKAKSYQLISPGYDGRYGVGGRYNGDTVDADFASKPDDRDNITNFAPGALDP